MSSGHRSEPAASVPEGLYEKTRALVDKATIDRSYDVRSTANRSLDGKFVYIDDSIPVILPRSFINSNETLPWHELSEWILMNEGIPYDVNDHSAHPIATAIEKMRVEELNGNWDLYTEEMDGYISEVDKKQIVDPPPDEDERVYDEDADTGAAANRRIGMTAQSSQARSWFAIRAAKDESPPEILIYDEIGLWGVTAADFNKGLKGLGDVKEINLRVNSPGGDVFDGIAIYNMLAAHPAKVTAHIDGIAASAASLIVMAADEVVAPENAFMVVHEPRAMTIGVASDHKQMADDLERMTDAFAKVYADRTKQPLDQVKALMKEDRLMTAKEAKEKGYVNTVAPNKQMSATFDLSKVPAKHKDAVAKVYIEETRQTPVSPVAAVDPKIAAAANTVELTEAERAEVMELCAIAGVSSRVAFQFITDKVKPQVARTKLVAAAAEAADKAGLVVHDASQATGATTEQILADKRKAQDAVKAEMGIGKRAKS